MQTTLLTLFFALFARLAFAIPPACLLHAVNTADAPGDLSVVCGDSATDIQSYMASNCGNFQDDAQKAFIATCSSAGTVVAEYTATANSTATSTRSSSATGTGMVTSTGTARSSGSASTSGTGASVQSTAGANIYYREGMGAMGAAAIALVGAVAAL